MTKNIKLFMFQPWMCCELIDLTSITYIYGQNQSKWMLLVGETVHVGERQGTRGNSLYLLLFVVHLIQL